ncbi:MAG: glycosyltransferase [Candidatus Shapirobacteria bacterium]|nr:glycosyltransferase [Candidatus Shapirobacteria bacterium]
MFFSIVIPCPKITIGLEKETVPAILKQGDNLEIIIVPDQKTSKKFSKTKILPLAGSPAQKRNYGLKQARGEIVVFIDDDAYPGLGWLENIKKNFNKDPNIVGVGGPGLTPPHDPFLAKTSGWFWASPLGSGGAGQYRNWPQKKRNVDDYPTFNLAVRKEALNKIGGFSCQLWPGEDTKLCLDLVYQLGKKIVYDPASVVFHHRRKVFLPRVKQLGRYGYHRGLFAKLFPQTSKKPGYFLPALFALGLLLGPLTYFFFFSFGLITLANFLKNLLLIGFALYLFLLLLNSLWVLAKSKNIAIAFLLLITVPISHIYYGIMFIAGLFRYLKD